MLIFGTILASRKSHDINVFWHIEYKKEHVINNGQINNIYRSSKKKKKFSGKKGNLFTGEHILICRRKIKMRKSPFCNTSVNN